MRIITFISCILGLFPLAFLTACTSYVEKVDYAGFIEVPQNRKAAPADLRRIKLDIPVGAVTGLSSAGSRHCGWPYLPMQRQDLERALDKESMRDAFDMRLEGLGYDIVGGREILFDDEEEDEFLRTEYLIGARITGIYADLCDNEVYSIFLLFNTTPGVEGELQMEVEWTVYDRLRQKTIFKTTSKGYAKRTIPNAEGVTLLMNDAFAMAAHNLGNSKDFRDVLYFDKKPDVAKQSLFEDPRPRPRHFKKDERVNIPAQKQSTRLFEEQLEDIKESIVLVQAGQGHGSGFIISREGHILTNSHVVGDALRVRVETSQKSHKLIAEVIRRDHERDVALLKIVDMPEDLNAKGLAIRNEWPEISETVFVIGAPLSKRLSETVTKGIVSAHRKDFQLIRNRNFIQADVSTSGGNSGGPLLDAHGNVVGIAVAGFDPNGSDAGLNVFIPINEALESLAVNQSVSDYDLKPSELRKEMEPERLAPLPSFPPKKESIDNIDQGDYFAPRGFKITFDGSYLDEIPEKDIYHDISFTQER